MSIQAVDELVRFTELRDEHAELRADRDRLADELQRQFPRGFTGNGVPGDFEGREMKWSDADREYRDFLRSEDGAEFKRLRAIYDPSMNVDRGQLAEQVES